MPGKLLYIASTVGHLNSFHRPYVERLAQEGWEIHTGGRGGELPLPGGSRGVDIPFEKSMVSLRNWHLVWKLRRLLLEERYDVISVHTTLAAFFTRLAVLLIGHRNRPLVINTVHGFLFDHTTPPLKKGILLAAEKITAPATHLLWTMNREDTQIALSHKLCRGPVEKIPGMGVDMTRFSPATVPQRQAARDRYGLCDRDFVLVYAAEFSKRKNQKWLIESMAGLPKNVKLLLAGQGTELESCKKRVQELNLEGQVQFCGFVSDIAVCYHAADVCVSASRSEGLPFNLMEAMHCALPVLATRVKGHEDLVTQGVTGYLFPHQNRAVFHQYLLSLLHSPAHTLELGQHGRDQAEQYRLDRVLEENMQRFHRWLERYAPHLSSVPSASVHSVDII